MKKTIIAAAALVAMTACNKTLIETPMTDSNYGYINLGITADTEMVVTKGVTATELDSYRICLYQVSGGNQTPYWAGKTINDVVVDQTGYITIAQAKANDDFWRVPAGSYKIFVENAEQTSCYSGKGKVYVSDEEDVTVFAGLPADVTLECTPKNSKVSFIYNDSFNTVFNTSNLSVTVSDRSLSLTPTYVSSSNTLESMKGSLDAAYYEADKTLTWSMSVKTTATGAVEKTYSSSFNTVEAKWTIVTFSAGSTEGTINVTITTNSDITETETITYTLNPINTDVNTDQN